MKRRFFAPTLLRAWLLATLLLAAQAAGLAHRVLHAPGQAPGHASGGATAASVATAAAAWGGSHAPGTADCRLIDQLAHADVLCGAAPAAEALPPATTVVLAALPQAVPARTTAAYLARAPPRG